MIRNLDAISFEFDKPYKNLLITNKYFSFFSLSSQKLNNNKENDMNKQILFIINFKAFYRDKSN